MRNSSNKPKVYLAGKISKNDWRHRLIPGLRNTPPYRLSLELSLFHYVGPFFKSCDHGCFHGPNTHGVAQGQQYCDEDIFSRDQVRTLCFLGIDQCDWLLAYITTLDCFGTLAEIQRALDLKKPVCVAFSPQISQKKAEGLWFLTGQTSRVYYNVSVQELARLLNQLVRGER